LSKAAPKGQYRRVSSVRWRDPFLRDEVSQALPNTNTLFDYLLTNEHTLSIPGLYPIGEGTILDDLGWPLAAGAEWGDFDRFAAWYPRELLEAYPYGLRECLQQLYAAGRVVYDHRAKVLFIPRRIEHEPPDNENHIHGWANIIRHPRFPKCDLVWQALRDMRDRLLTLKNDAPWVSQAFQRHFPEVRKAGPLPTWERGGWHPPMGSPHGNPPASRKNGVPASAPISAASSAAAFSAENFENQEPEQDFSGGMASPHGIGGGDRGSRRKGGSSSTAACFAPPPSLRPSPKKPVVVVGRKKSAATHFSNRTTTTTNGQGDHYEGPPVDSCGFEVRNCDLAADLLGEVLAEFRRQHGQERLLPVECWGVSLSEKELELGVADNWALDAVTERNQDLAILEALKALHPEMQVRWSVAPRPQPRPEPAVWSLEQALAWFAKNGLTGGAGGKALKHFWRQVQQLEVTPSELMAAAKAYRQTKNFEDRDWPVAVFMTDGVWKRRVPRLVAMDAAAAGG